MSKERIDTLFRQKLEDHRTPPPAQLWDKLEEQLGDEEEKKRGGWIIYRVAAAVVLLILVGWWGTRTNWTDQTQLSDTGESEEVQNIALTGESEEVQNLVDTGEPEEVQNLVATGESEEVQNQPARLQMASTGESEEVQNLFATGESEEVQNLFATGESEEVQNQLVAQVETSKPSAALASLENISTSLGVAFKPVQTSIAQVDLVEIPEGLIPNWNEFPEDLDLQDAVAFAREMKQGDFSLADLRDAKKELGEENPISLASLRDAKNEFLTFNWVGDDD
ncbi:MAG TPA: hypothetical protein DCE41_24095 [Cytophagales bacterium]|nr:hypothetical protein [Cytophagales bacterium]HAA18810.1 hypothetical protein [Cytophagales bacterium]HAP64360.1 hypothetical protein [Cytophagales bacterium]